MEMYEKHEDLEKVHILLGHIRVETSQLCAQLRCAQTSRRVLRALLRPLFREYSAET